MKWFKRHREWLEAACRDLATSSDYQQQHQHLGNVLASSGSILVRLNKLVKHPALVVFPDATPYVPPVVYLMQEVLSEDDLTQVADTWPRVNKELIPGKVEWYYKRHQNPDGSLCIIEGDHLYADRPELFAVRDVIKRVRDWLAGLSTGRMPPDSPEVDFYAHYPYRVEEIHFLVPELFFNLDTIEGLFVAMRPDLLTHALRSMYFIGGTIGADAGGISHPPIVVNDEQQHLFAELPDLISELAAGKLVTDQEKGIIVGYWLTVNTEPIVFADVAQIAEAVSPDTPEQGITSLVRLVRDPLVRCEKHIHLGLRFPNRRGDLEWQMLQLARPEGLLGFVKASDEDLAEQLKRYEIAAIRTIPFTDAGFHRRNEGRASRTKLRDSWVSVIGCGAIGSEVADTLAKAGVGNITLIDYDFLHPNNVVRHILGLDFSEFPKTHGLKVQMFAHNGVAPINRTHQKANVSFEKRRCVHGLYETKIVQS